MAMGAGMLVTGIGGFLDDSLRVMDRPPVASWEEVCVEVNLWAKVVCCLLIIIWWVQ